MPVAEHRRRGLAVLARADLTDRERVALPVEDLALATAAANLLRHPGGRRQDVAPMQRVGADGRNPEELRELVQPGLLDGRHEGAD